MSLLAIVTGFFVIKGLLAWPFYYWKKFLPLFIGLAASLAVAPLITILYHESDLDFWWVYLFMIVLDVLLYCMLLQRLWWKAILISFFLNTIAIIYFFLGNG